MKILYGLKNGALLQRNSEDLCVCRFGADVNGALNSSIGAVIKRTEGVYELVGVPTGGPYEVRLWDADGEVVLSDIYVGDVWLLGGQSNMEGAGKLRDKQKEYDENPTVSVRAYYMREEWDAARSQLHQRWESADECIKTHYRDTRNPRWGTPYPARQDNGVGPGLYFALEMQKILGGVPQGLIPCAIGGATLAEWHPDGKDNFYTAAVRRVKECGGYIKGVFWYQGESQAIQGRCENFISDMQYLVSSMREDFGDEQLPFVQVQIHKYVAAPKKDDAAWMQVREAQRRLCRHIDRIETVSSADCEMDDFIHISSESHEKLGRRAAHSMQRLLTGEGVPTPDIDCFEITVDDYVPFYFNLRVRFKNVVGALTSKDFPWGFTVLQDASGESKHPISRVCLEGDSVRIKTELDANVLKDAYVCYGYGNDYYCNITDGAGRALPAFGPLRVGDYLREKDL